MTAAYDETAGARGGDGNGLPGSATHARMQAVSGNIMARQRPDVPSLVCQGGAILSEAAPRLAAGAVPSSKSAYAARHAGA